MSESYEPLDKVRKKLRIKWYRCPIERDKLRELNKRSNLRGLLQALGHLMLMAGTGVLTYYLFLQQTWIGFACALYTHGIVAAFAWGTPGHELLHGTVFKTKWLNRAFLYIFAMIGWQNFREGEMSHTYHHKYTLHTVADREVVLPLYPSLNVWYLLQLFTINFTGGYESRGIIQVIRDIGRTALGKYRTESTGVSGAAWLKAVFERQPAQRKLAVNWARVILLFHIVVIGVSIVSGLWLLPVLVTFPWCIGSWWRYFVGVTMHCGLRDNVPDFRKCTRSVTIDPVSEFLYWRMNWHTEHHMFAGVPCYNLKKLSRVIADDMPKPRTLVGAWREMRAVWKRQQTDPSYQFDTPVPQPAVAAGLDQDPLAASIGDLAPKVLR